jgi:AcrR family transcriptional regulator
MTLYYYVDNKDEILNGIADLIVGEIELPPPGADWKAAIRKTAISAHQALLRHPWAANLVLSASGFSQARMQYMNALLGCLREAGFSPEMTDLAYHALESHIMGFTLWVVGMNLGSDEDVAALASDFLRDFPRDELPHLAEHIEQHMKPREPADEGAFAFGLDLLLDGLERLRGAS